MQNNLNSSTVLGQGVEGGGVEIDAPAKTPAKRPRGRPKGTPNPSGKKIPGSGRKKGTPNKATMVGRKYLIKRSSSLPFLCDVSAGRKVKVADPKDPSKKIEVYPSFADRLKASQILAPMIVPTLRAMEMSGQQEHKLNDADGNPLTFKVNLVPGRRVDEEETENDESNCTA